MRLGLAAGSMSCSCDAHSDTSVCVGASDTVVSRGNGGDETRAGTRIYVAGTCEKTMKHRGLGWLFGIAFVLAAWFVGCSPRTQHIVVDPPRSWARADWDTFIDGLPGKPGQVEIDNDTSSATSGLFDVTIFRDKRIVLPGGVHQIYAGRSDLKRISYEVQFSWGSQKGATAQRLLRELIAQFSLTDVSDSSAISAWRNQLRVSETCEYDVVALLRGVGGVRSYVQLVFSTTNGSEAPVCS